MFTGLVEAVVPVLEFHPRGTGAALVLPCPQLEPEQVPWDAAPGDSVSCSGCCLTVARVDEGPGGARMTFELSAETLSLTWLGEARPGRQVNLERALRLQDRLGGHLVSGHVDGLGRVEAVADPGDGGWRVTFSAAAGFARWLVQKGSVTVDGISLTVVDPRPAPEGDRTWFDVAVIPETLQRTSLGQAAPGTPVHLEGDLVGKWIDQLALPHVQART